MQCMDGWDPAEHSNFTHHRPLPVPLRLKLNPTGSPPAHIQKALHFEVPDLLQVGAIKLEAGSTSHDLT